MAVNQEIALQRLVAQRLAGPRWDSPTEVVRHLGAVQAQDLRGALTSVALRVAGGTSAGVRAALDAGEIVRTWPMRGTLHFVPAEDAGWMMAIAGPRMDVSLRRRMAEFGFNDLDRAREQARQVAEKALAGTRGLPRAELAAHWAQAGLAPEPRAALLLLHVLCGTGELALGPMTGDDQLVVRLADWVPQPADRDPEAGLTEWVRRYALSHGPVTDRDTARWFGLPLGMVRPALTRAEGVEQVGIEGRTYYRDPALPDLLAEHRREARRLMLLPGFDEFMLGYTDRTFAVPPAQIDQLVPGGNGVFRATVVKTGKVLGFWRRGGTPDRPAVQVDPLAPLGPRTEASVRRAFERLP
ncbi:MAG TPA: winged helix DNA-binding domain-containing protein [Candidatus Ruania gallistercoris]|uniref:Winged helix DNA-binding domain-containing protein n=1 Tax=Candidatus Ruania gallistercoris TaxID=2838746 RepID=A0A9D2EE80_9MICO|nr:winged helix DNA-binding domain-containing protein [Candidatus Ruania gallistercoris]